MEHVPGPVRSIVPTRQRTARLLVMLLAAASLSVLFSITAGTVAIAEPGPAPADSSQLITVSTAGPSATSGTLSAWDRSADGGWTRVFGPVMAWVGERGVGQTSEGAQRTPVGTYPLTEAFGRQPHPGTAMPYFTSDRLDWWDENPASPTYNTHVRQSPGPGGASENLYTSGPVYDYAVNIGYNLQRVPGAGSAFFLHVTDGTPTAGCVSIDRTTLVGILRWLDPDRHPTIDIRVGAEWSPASTPIGALDTLGNPAPGQLDVSGWAADPGAPGATEAVHVYVTGPGGTVGHPTATGGPRPDVAAVFPWAGPGTGYTTAVPVAAGGRYQVCAYAINVHPPQSNPVVGCRGTTVSDVFGTLDAVSAAGGVLTVQGWALNPNAPGDPVEVHVYDMGPTVRGYVLTADINRSDVAAAYPGYSPNHGFNATLPVGEPGLHNVCVYAINAHGGSSSNPLLSCRQVQV